jgi:hypothetical protein
VEADPVNITIIRKICSGTSDDRFEKVTPSQQKPFRVEVQVARLSAVPASTKRPVTDLSRPPKRKE